MNDCYFIYDIYIWYIYDIYIYICMIYIYIYDIYMIYIYDIYIYMYDIYIWSYMYIYIIIYMYINISSSLGNYLLWPPTIYGVFCPSSSWWSQALPVPSLPSTAARCCSRCQPQCTAQLRMSKVKIYEHHWRSWFIHVSSVDACYLLLMVWKKKTCQS